MNKRTKIRSNSIISYEEKRLLEKESEDFSINKASQTQKLSLRLADGIDQRVLVYRDVDASLLENRARFARRQVATRRSGQVHLSPHIPYQRRVSLRHPTERLHRRRCFRRAGHHVENEADDDDNDHEDDAAANIHSIYTPVRN